MMHLLGHVHGIAREAARNLLFTSAGTGVLEFAPQVDR